MIKNKTPHKHNKKKQKREIKDRRDTTCKMLILTCQFKQTYFSICYSIIYHINIIYNIKYYITDI